MNKTFIAFISIFCITLQALYFSAIRLAPFPLLGLLAIILTHYRRFNFRELKEMLPFCVLILMSLCIGLLNLAHSSSIRFYPPTLFGWFLFPVALIYCKRLFNNDGVNINKALKWVLIVHLAFFYLQFFAFTLFYIKFDFIEVITGEAQRTGATKLKSYGSSVIRAAGLFTEPGSYCVYIYILLTVIFLVKRKIDYLMTIALLSMFLTFSMTGMLMGAFIILFYISELKLKLSWVFSSLLLGITISSFFLYFSGIYLGPILSRLVDLRTDGSSLQRFQGGFANFVSENYFLTGLGAGFQHIDVVGTSVYLSGLYNLGFIGFLCFVLTLFIKIRDVKITALLIPVFFSNINIVQIIFVLFISIFYSQHAKIGRSEGFFINK